MACFWKNERNAVEVCSREVGNYVYIGYVDPDPWYSMIEVARDLSGYVATEIDSGETTVASNNNTLYSKRKQIYQLRYNTTPNPDAVTVWKASAAAEFTEVAGVPTGLAALTHEVIYSAGKLRGINYSASFTNVFLYESDDGETWSLLSGSTAIPYTTAGGPSYYTLLGSRIIVNRISVPAGAPQFYYSDNSGATWSGSTGAALVGESGKRAFLHSGSNVLAVANALLHVSSNGAAWTQYPNLNISSGIGGGYAAMAASGTGLVVAYGTQTGTSDGAFAYSANHGASWALVTQAAAGLPATADSWSLFWNTTVTQFVIFVQDGSTYQIYTSPTGQNWTAGIVIPEIVQAPTQVID